MVAVPNESGQLTFTAASNLLGRVWICLFKLDAASSSFPDEGATVQTDQPSGSDF